MTPRSVLKIACLILASLCFVIVTAQNGDTPDEASGEYELGEDSVYVSGPDAMAIDTDCSTKKNGLHGIAGCSPKFLTCSSGTANLMDCPSGLIFDSRISACQWSYSIQACSKVPQDAPTVEHLASPTCASGVSAIAPCFQVYKSCVDGEMTAFTCDGDLFFSAEQGKCVPADQIAECQK